jgi:hypothetical protein
VAVCLVINLQVLFCTVVMQLTEWDGGDGGLI